MTTTFKKIFSARNVFITILSLACLLALWWTLLDAHVLYRSEERVQMRDALTHRPAEISDIANWMTFDYINVIFKLPRNYLKDQLNITDPHYPNIQVSRFARRAGMSQQQAVTKIQDAVKSFQGAGR